MKDTTKLGDGLGRKTYHIGIGDIGTQYFAVNDCAITCDQDAIDAIADYCADQEWLGFFGDDENNDYTEAYYNDTHPDHAYAQDMFAPAGNSDRLFTNEIHFNVRPR